MNSFNNKVAAITGAGSGLGRALAEQLAEQGCHLALSDINADGLAQTVALVATHGVRCTHTVLDVSDKDAVYAWAEATAQEHSQVNLIFNNAGVALGDTIQDMRYEDFEWIMNINFWGVVYGTKAFLPFLKQSGDGHVINISSVFGLISVPTQGAYNSAKFAVRGFTEALREELFQENAGVSCTSVHPGGIKTNIINNGRLHKIAVNQDRELDKDRVAAQFDKNALTTPHRAAEIILAGVKRNKARVLVGTDAKVLDGIQRLLPSAYQRIVSYGANLRAKSATD